MNQTLKLGHNPLGRFTVRKEMIIDPYMFPCSWCGSKPAKFHLRVKHDNGRGHELKGGFCSMDCARSYHE